MNKRLEIIKIVAIYVFFGFIWISFSDLTVEWLGLNPETVTKISIFKGFLFITLTSALLYSLIARLSGKLNQSVQALYESEKRLNFLIKNSTDSLVIINADGSQRHVSPAAKRITGFSVVELEGRKIDSLIHQDDLKAVRTTLDEAIEHPEKTVTVQYRHVHKTKGWVYLEAVAQSFLTEPAINGIIASVRDISERKRAEEAFAVSTKLLYTVINTVPVRIFFKDKKLRYMGCNNAFAADAGAEGPEDLIGKDDYQLVWKDQAERYRADDTAVIETGEARLSYDEPQTTPEGGLIWLRTSKVPLRNESNNIIGVLGMYEDITDRKRVESELRESEDKFSQTFKSSPDAISINRLDDGFYVDINEGFTRITGYTRDDVIGKTSLELDIWHAPKDRKQLVKEIREKGYYENLETQFRKKDGSLITGLMSARMISLKGIPHLVSVSRDITERKTYEKEQLKLEKLESLGILAGGIAHDFNNILTGIMGNISFAKVFLDATHQSSKPLLEAEKAAGRAGELAHQLLTFARGGEPIKKVVSLKHIVNEALTFILRGSNVKGTVEIPDTIHALEADEGQLNQVFQNIVINATQAMPGGGVLTVTARNEEILPGNKWSLPPGAYIRLIFADQGCGISENDLKKIFDPYFTTKSAGIGLGLSSVHSIINKHGGHIEARSVIGEGTTITIYLPSVGKVVTDFQKKVVEHTAEDHKGGFILVMDDDEMIRDLSASILTHLGYQVTTCSSGEEAVELYKASVKSGTPYLACFVDLTIPGGLGGQEVAQQILSSFPNARLVVSSGYSNDPIMSNFEKFGFRGAIAKPYNTQEFANVLASVLSDT